MIIRGTYSRNAEQAEQLHASPIRGGHGKLRTTLVRTSIPAVLRAAALKERPHTYADLIGSYFAVSAS
jgi:hypothetical protein